MLFNLKVRLERMRILIHLPALKSKGKHRSLIQVYYLFCKIGEIPRFIESGRFLEIDLGEIRRRYE